MEVRTVSGLFRRETARRLTAKLDETVERYEAKRPSWLNAFRGPDPEAVRQGIIILAQAIATGDIASYRGWVSTEVEALIEGGVPPIAILAASELLYATVLAFLTPDQRRLVEDLLDASRAERQAVIYDRVIAPLVRLGA